MAGAGGQRRRAVRRRAVAPRGRTAAAGLPAKRGRSAGPAPIFQIKVGLRGAKPPIWRRLEVPADISLAGLHTVVQIAFGWDDSHRHVFQTPFGDYGIPDAQLGHCSEASVSLHQIAPKAGSKICYIYDFGDDWQHDIVVEKILDRDPTATYPRCTGGRRAAPPDDGGGIGATPISWRSSTTPTTQTTTTGWNGSGSTAHPTSTRTASTPRRSPEHCSPRAEASHTPAKATHCIRQNRTSTDISPVMTQRQVDSVRAVEK
jgi:Plasmid pRiA4b ORF-3-like protein